MQKDEKNVLNIALIFTAIIFAVLAGRFLNFVALNYNVVDGSEVWFKPTIAVTSLAFGILSTYFLQRDQERHEYFLGAIGELRKVHFPSWEDTRKLTTIVCIVVAIFAVILSVFDWGWAYVLKQILS